MSFTPNKRVAVNIIVKRIYDIAYLHTCYK